MGKGEVAPGFFLSPLLRPMATVDQLGYSTVVVAASSLPPSHPCRVGTCRRRPAPGVGLSRRPEPHSSKSADLCALEDRELRAVAQIPTRMPLANSVLPPQSCASCCCAVVTCWSPSASQDSTQTGISCLLKVPKRAIHSQDRGGKFSPIPGFVFYCIFIHTPPHPYPGKPVSSG